VSVVIPTYKHARLVLQTLDSVFAQTFSDYEIIVVNDGSPDDTAERLAPLVQAGKIRYFEQPNAGQSHARNRGVSEARGEFLALLDDDDLWPPDKLQWQVQALRDAPSAVLAYGSMETFGGDPIYSFPKTDAPSGRVKARFFEQNWMRSPGQTLIRTETFRAVGGFDPSVWGCEDWELFLRLADAGEFVYENRLALRYRNHPNNASKDVWRMFINAMKVRQKHMGRYPKPADFKSWRACGRFIRGFSYLDALRGADLAAEGGDVAKALRMWWLAVWVKPRGIFGSLRVLKRAILASAKAVEQQVG
jgi:glycosyltransferase involved in cell wall biosynthesis